MPLKTENKNRVKSNPIVKKVKNIENYMINKKYSLSFSNYLQSQNINEVAVIGNGPIFESDFHQINKYPFIIQFNHGRYIDKINRCNVLVIRPLENHKEGIEKVQHLKEIFKKISINTLILPILIKETRVKNIEFINVKKNKILKPIKSFEKIAFEQDQNDLIKNNFLFNCQEEICKYSSSANGPSTGGIVLSELFKYKFIKKIHVFGMNFNGNDGHLDFLNPHIVKNYCTKCIFHQTSDSSYR